MTNPATIAIIAKTNVRFTFSPKVGCTYARISKIAPDIDNLCRQKVALLKGLSDQFSIANAVIKDICSDIDRANHRIKSARTSWLTANFLDPPDKAYECPNCPSPHAVVAVDGSQIAPGKHEIVFCYLLNTAAIIIYYGTGDKPSAETKPKLCFTEDELYEDYAGRRVQIIDKFLAMRRTLAESEHLEQAICLVASKTSRPWLSGTEALFGGLSKANRRIIETGCLPDT